MQTFENVKELPTLLLSRRPVLLYGHVHFVYGQGEVGKGRLIMSAVGAVTRGDPVGLDEDGDDPGDVVLISGEDRPGEDIVGRLIAEDADLRRVHDLSRINGVRAKFPRDLPVVRSYIDQLRRSCMCNQTFSDVGGLYQHLVANPAHRPRNPRMVVGDPLGTLVSKGSTISTEAGARAWFELVDDMAEQTGVAVVLVAHPTKDGKVMRGSGSLRDAARVVLYVHWDEVNKSHRVVEVEKGNNVPDELRRPIRYTIEPRKGDGRPHVVWSGKKDAPAVEYDWRAVLAAQKTVRAEAKAKAAVAAAMVHKPATPGKPFRAISWHRAADGTETPAIVGDAVTEEDAKHLAYAKAGCLLTWTASGTPQAPQLLSAPVRDTGGGITMFLVYPAAKVKTAAA